MKTRHKVTEKTLRGGQLALFTKNVDFSRRQTRLGCVFSFTRTQQVAQSDKCLLAKRDIESSHPDGDF